jgi:hypothetical protein
MSDNKTFIQLLKNHTSIDEDFIDTFFINFKIGSELDFKIKDKDIARFLNIKLITLRNRLNNVYSKKKIYFENVDFIKIKIEHSQEKIYMINYSCFERLAMNSDSVQSEVIRLYFSKLREFISENQHILFQAMENNINLKEINHYEVIYFFAVDNKKFKIGHSSNIIQRLRNYNIGRIKEVELKYLAIVKHRKLIESCMKLNLKDNKVFNNREIYEIEPNKLKKIIDECYCKYVSKKESEILYKEISDLLGLYAYTKDKKNIKPYIIIGKNL